jgi:bifunctional non-homologous end joining protein LigD
MAKAATHTVEIAGITLTHPDRVLWPTQGVTKRRLAEFYVRISDRILPHVANRPLTVVRCPSGGRSTCFVQKHPWAGLPKAVRPIRSDGEEWLTVDDVSGLVSLVQMGVLELHPWGATADDLDHPDRIIFDLDPDRGVPWAHVVEGARAIGTVLEELGLRGFVKATGGQGLRAQHSSADCRGTARTLHHQSSEGGPQRPNFPGPSAQQPRCHRGGRVLDPRAARRAGGDSARVGGAGR